MLRNHFQNACDLNALMNAYLYTLNFYWFKSRLRWAPRFAPLALLALFGLIKIKETLSPPQDKYEAFTRENEGKKNRPLNCYLFDFLCVPNKERCQAANMRINKAHTRT